MGLLWKMKNDEQKLINELQETNDHTLNFEKLPQIKHLPRWKIKLVSDAQYTRPQCRSTAFCWNQTSHVICASEKSTLSTLKFYQCFCP